MWEHLGSSPAPRLAEARLLAHWAAQAIASVGSTHVPARDDFSHTALTWNDSLGSLLGEPLPGHGGVRASLRVGRLELGLVQGSAVVARFSLAGSTLQAGLDWLAAQLQARSGSETPTPLARPQHDLPDHLVGEGEAFPKTLDEAALTELAHWFGDAAELLERFVPRSGSVSPLRCWPHHFDLARLVTLAGSGEDAASIGLGLSPGDRTYPAPYFYVGPWPYPEDRANAPELAVGRWHTEGFFAAVLPHADLVDVDAAKQEAVVEQFLAAADRACRTLLRIGADGSTSRPT